MKITEPKKVKNADLDLMYNSIEKKKNVLKFLCRFIHGTIIYWSSDQK